MIKHLLFALIATMGASAFADVVVPTRTIRADAVILEKDVTLQDGAQADVFARLHDVIGQEARVVLYAGRPIRLDEIGPPAIVSRNQIIGAYFEGSGLRIATEARALERGGVGDFVRVMNLASRATLVGQVQRDGTIRINN
jgi:flagella basal body P-ring formation protein FlgA